MNNSGGIGDLGARLALAAIAALAAWGCTTVSSVEPMGERPHPIDPAVWEGTWVSPEDALTLQVLDAAAGKIRIAWIEEEEGEPALNTLTAQLWESDGRVFANVDLRELEDEDPLDVDDDPEETLYLFVLVRKDGSDLVLWTPRLAAFRELVEEGVLPGTVEEHGVTIGRLTPAQLAVITGERLPALFRLDEPAVLRRLVPEP